MSFEDWMATINELLIQAVGLESDDLPDQNYYDHWEDGLAPADVLDIMREDGDIW